MKHFSRDWQRVFNHISNRYSEVLLEVILNVNKDLVSDEIFLPRDRVDLKSNNSLNRLEQLWKINNTRTSTVSMKAHPN